MKMKRKNIQIQIHLTLLRGCRPWWVTTTPSICINLHTILNIIYNCWLNSYVQNLVSVVLTRLEALEDFQMDCWRLGLLCFADGFLVSHWKKNVYKAQVFHIIISFYKIFRIFFYSRFGIGRGQRSFRCVGKTIQFSQLIKTQLFVSNYCI